MLIILAYKIMCIASCVYELSLPRSGACHVDVAAYISWRHV